MQLSPQTIRNWCTRNQPVTTVKHKQPVISHEPLIKPFRESYTHELSGLSGGLSCAGYDVHLSHAYNVKLGERRLFNDNILFDGSVNAENPGQCDGMLLPKGTGCLGITEERFHLPNNMCMHYINKSTLARKFIDASATLAEPGWCGHLTLEIKNNSDVDQYIYFGQPIGQVVFHMLDKPSDRPYNGKYQNAEKKPQGAK